MARVEEEVAADAVVEILGRKPGWDKQCPVLVLVVGLVRIPLVVD